MRIPFVDLKKQYLNIKDDIQNAISKVIEDAAFIGGEDHRNFISNLKDLVGIDHVLPVGNGTDAIYIALKMLGVSNGDEIITTSHSWISTSETISQAGGRPVFVDTNEFFCIDDELIESKITEKTKGIIPVHLYGHASNMDRIMRLAKKHNLFVIEDCAQAILTKWSKQNVGTFGDVGTFSFFPGKNLGAYGDAGGTITNNENLFYDMKRFANHGSLVKHQHEIEGINSRLDNIQAAILNVKIKYIRQWIENRRAAADFYNEKLSEIEEIEIPKEHNQCEHSYHLYVIKTNNREGLAKFLNQKGIETGIHYPKALPALDCYKYLNLDLADYKNSISDSKRILSLPIIPEIDHTQIDYVVGSIKDFIAGNV